MARNWYVIHTYSGYENKVKTNLEKAIQNRHMEDKIFNILVPTEEEVEVKDGKKRLVKKKIFPGYVLVEMEMTDESWYVVRNTPGVTGFVGSGSKPIPLQPQEVRAILKQMGVAEAKPAIHLTVGQPVKVTSGPFAGFVGNVEEVSPDRGKVRLLVSMFGRETPLEVDFDQVEEV
jgi:transcriptional antiterminator NusG